MKLYEGNEKSKFVLYESRAKVVYLLECERGQSIFNDAENVLREFAETHPGYHVVYRHFASKLWYQLYWKSEDRAAERTWEPERTMGIISEEEKELAALTPPY